MRHDRSVVVGLLSGAAVVSAACTLPTDTLSNTITAPFSVQIQNISYPDVHDFYMHLLAAGGGDQHLFIGPVGVPTNDLTLVNGGLTHIGIHANIGGEFSDVDHTTKMFMTERNEQLALFQPTYACNPDDNTAQIELRFVGRQNDPAGGWICVRPTFDGAHEFRYYPPGDELFDPNRPCTKVTLVVRFSGASASTTTTATTSSSTSSTSTSTSTSTSSSTTSSTSTSTRSTTTTTSTSSTTSTASTTTSTAPGSTLNPKEPATIGTWSYIGCHKDLVNGVRTLSGASSNAAAMTLESCAAACAGYNFFGTEYGVECYCGWTLDTTLKAPETDCNAACGGNANEICGTGARLSVYKNSVVSQPPAAPQHVASSSGYTWLGCYSEATNGRALTGPSIANDKMTVEMCLASCAGYTYGGVEYGRECYCGNTIQAGSTSKGVTDCSNLCSGSSLQYCGGPGRLDMYILGSATSISSTTTSTSSTSTSTTSTTSTTRSTTTTTSTTSSTPATNTATTTTSTTFSTSTTSSTTTGPAATGKYNYVGCFSDLSDGHALPLLFANSSVTPELCQAYVQSLANKPTPTVLPYFFLEFHHECYGGSVFNWAGSAVTSLTGSHACTDVCSGSMGAASTGTASCGGAKQFNLYALGTSTIPGPIQTQAAP